MRRGPLPSEDADGQIHPPRFPTQESSACEWAGRVRRGGILTPILEGVIKAAHVKAGGAVESGRLPQLQN
jgi:hypothetical protein